MGPESDSARQTEFQQELLDPFLLLLGQWIDPFTTVAGVEDPATIGEPAIGG